MCYPFEEGWADTVRSIDPNQVALSTNKRLKAILRRFLDWSLFPNPSPRISFSRIMNCDIYFYFHWNGPVKAYSGKAYIGFLVPKMYEELHGEKAEKKGKSPTSISSRNLRPVELVLAVASEYRFNPNTDGLNSYSGGPYRRAYIPGADEIWIVEFEEDWNCKEV